jgi:diketogulonate reductase-like aldo/keto reductase
VWTRGAAAGIAQMRESSRRLGRLRLDLIQVHNLVDCDTHLATLQRWKREGLVCYVGITHYQVSAHDELMRLMRRYRPDFVQFNYSVVTRAAERELLPLAAELGIAVIVNRAFEDGRLFEIVRDRALPGFAAEVGCDSWAQLFLKYVLSHQAVTCVIPATGKLRHLQDNLKAGRGRLLDPAQAQSLIGLLERV